MEQATQVVGRPVVAGQKADHDVPASPQLPDGEYRGADHQGDLGDRSREKKGRGRKC